jgi:hypothetical protein
MHLEKRYSVSHLWWFIFYQRKKSRMYCVTYDWLSTKREEALVRVINYPARGIEIQQSKNLRLLPITTNVPSEVMQNIDKIDLKLNWNQTKIARFCNDDSKFSGY